MDKRIELLTEDNLNLREINRQFKEKIKLTEESKAEIQEDR